MTTSNVVGGSKVRVVVGVTGLVVTTARIAVDDATAGEAVDIGVESVAWEYVSELKGAGCGCSGWAA